MKTKSSSNINDIINMGRDDLIKASTALIKETHKAMKMTRYQNQEYHNIKVKYVGAHIRALQTHNSILDSKLKDEDLKQLHERMDQLESDLKEGGPNEMISLKDLSNRLDDLESSISLETWEQQTSDGTTQTFKSNDGLKTFVDWMHVLADQEKDGHAMTCNDVYGVLVNA